MNFDDLKNEWKADGLEETNISEEMLKIKQAHTPIDIIRKKMKREFYYQLLALLFMTGLPYLLKLSADMTMLYFVFFFITCGFTGYYFVKFYRFYKNSYDMSVDSRKNILWFYYEMKLNVELYKALTYIIVFIWVAFLSVFTLIEKAWVVDKFFNKLPPFYLLINCFVTVLVIGVITELWAWHYYGKYLKRIKKIVDELNYEH
ncbi:hypothetical protein [Pedobacter sp. Leaf176]|uniref:hypothetical protein n=1 Tax=Pedobacter sp. Leaf176 TaxID=1736286 RepID=UPI0006F5F41D|nr:hypothetical protein [Pedobacter sp. Leaf176]KQR70329.1 hypothetical protein ASF92_10105 [Pedobacter sp. Leaf176]